MVHAGRAQVASAFSQMLNLHNLSEEISNAQIEKASRIGEVSPPLLTHLTTLHCWTVGFVAHACRLINEAE